MANFVGRLLANDEDLQDDNNQKYYFQEYLVANIREKELHWCPYD